MVIHEQRMIMTVIKGICTRFKALVLFMFSPLSNKIYVHRDVMNIGDDSVLFLKPQLS